MHAPRMLFCGMLTVLGLTAGQAEVVQLNVRPLDDGLQLWWSPSGEGLAGPAEFRVEESSDLVNWRLRARVILEKGRTEPWSARYQTDNPSSFFRVASRFQVNLVRSEGAEVLGYDGVFRELLDRIGQITPEEFAGLYPDPADYIEGISWDPTTAVFFQDYNTPPAKPGARDFTLNDQELEVYKRLGFVVSPRLGAPSFADVYYDIFVRDLPVFVTADSILHAWHKSFEGMLEQLEDAYLYTLLERILDGMAEALPALARELEPAAWDQSLRDADYYLALARTLLHGETAAAHFGQEEWINSTLAAIEEGAMIPFDIFGRLERDPFYLFDFSQFKVRGHYENSERLQRYFRAMIWCGRVDLRVAGNPAESSPRELGTALVLSELLERSGQFENWASFDQVIQTFVGRKDSMDPRQMANIREVASLESLAEITSTDGLAGIRAAIQNGSYGIQQILGNAYQSPFGPEQTWLPRSFGLMGQRFTMDAWALGKVVFDRIFWDEDGIPTVQDKVQRRRISGLDVAFSVLNNDLPGPEIVERIQNQDGYEYRDGLYYQHNLAAVRETINRRDPRAWEESIYTEWLAALRELSPATTDSRFPESMRTREWAFRRLNTQLASWTQLRHDTILYAKQTYVGHILCFYPAGFIEPLPAFWRRLGEMASRAAGMIAALKMEGEVIWQARDGFSDTGILDLAVVQSNQVTFLNRFAATMQRLEGMSRKELAQEPFSDQENEFMANLIEHMYSYTGEKQYSGWYPGLFYRSNEGFDEITFRARSQGGFLPDEHEAAKAVALVADVLTASRDQAVGDPGAIVHQAVGNAAFMLVAVDNGSDRMAFGGPVFTYHEFDRPLNERLTDSEWRETLKLGQQPPPPEWTRNWMVLPSAQ